MKFSKKQLLQWVAALFAVIVFAFSEINTAFAGTADVTMSFPIHLEFGKEGLNPSKAYQLVIKAENSDSPMPQDAEKGVWTLSISKKIGTDYAIEIRYQNPGEYWYEIELEDAVEKKLASDWLHVQVIQDNGKLTPKISLRENSKTSEKVAEFTAKDPDQPSDTSTPTPTISGTPGITPTTTPTPTVSETPASSVTPTVPVTSTASITPTTTVTASTTPASSVIPTIPGGNNNNSGGKSNSNSTNSKVSTGKVSTGDTANTRIWQVCLGISVSLLVLFLSATVRNNRKRS